MAEPVEGTEQTSYTTDPNAVDWKTFASEDNRGALDNYENMDALIAAKKSFETSARSKASLPTAEATDEELSAFYSKLAPESTDAYKYDLPEGMEPIEGLSKIKDIAKAKGISVKQYADVAPVVDQVIQEAVESVVSSYAPSQEDCVKGLTDEWKGDTEKNIAIAGKAFAKYGGDDLLKYLEDTGIGNQPLLVKAFFKIAQDLVDDEGIQGTPTAAPEKKASPYGDAFNQRYSSETPA